MTPQQFEQVQDLFLKARQLAPTQRESLLRESSCGGDDQLLAEVKSLLAADEEGGPGLTLIPPPAAGGLKSLFEKVAAPSTIDRYHLLEIIGEGGMGTVYKAEQRWPVKRTVALKLIKLGMDTKQVIARFEAERQALAMMNHPNIAKVLDAGASDAGHSFFVMEYVPGIPITRFADENKLSIKDRLELFILVCDAIGHAHTKAILHRDIKAGNVLACMQDGKPTAKVIDFGVAKALTTQRLTDLTFNTAQGLAIGTYESMSPEQAAGSPDIDTRTDVYSLGVLLYELLSGAKPFDRETLARASEEDIRRMIREIEPPRPSARFGSLGDSAEKIAAARQTRVDALQKDLRGELEWIPLMAMRKERARRYDSPQALAHDIRNYLEHRPLLAGPESKRYRLRKYFTRHKVGVLAGSAVAAALAIGVTLASVGFVQARRQTEITRMQAARSDQVAQFLKEMLKSAGPSVARGRDATMLREILDKTAARVDSDLREQPEVQGDLWMTLGDTCSDMDDAPRAITYYERAAASYRAALGSENPKLALALGGLGSSQSFSGNVAAGRANAQLGLDMARKSGDANTLAWCLASRAAASRSFGMGSAEGVPYLREALALRKQLGNRPVALADCMRSLAACGLSGTAEGESLLREALALHRQHLEPDHPKIAADLHMLGQSLLVRGKPKEAETVLRETLDQYRKVQARDQSYQPVVRRFLAQAVALQGRWDEADAILKEAPTNIVPLDENRAFLYRNVGNILANQGKLDEAIVSYRKGLEYRPRFEFLHVDLGNALEKLDQHDQAMEVFRKAIEVQPNKAAGYNRLAWMLATSSSPGHRDPARAVELARRAVELVPNDGAAWNTLGAACYRAGDWRQAVAALDKSIALDSGGSSDDFFFLAMSHWQLGDREQGRKWYDKAIEWMGKNRPNDRDLGRFRAEAAELIGQRGPTTQF